MRRHLLNVAGRVCLRTSLPTRSFSRAVPKDGLDMNHFLSSAMGNSVDDMPEADLTPNKEAHHQYEQGTAADKEPLLKSRQFYIETYGCQMNTSDSEIVIRILQKAGMAQTETLDDAEVILVNTCAIRDNAENKVWERLGYLKHLKKKKRLNKQAQPVVGVLGCMAERLKQKLVESDKMVDLVAGPDAYRDLPRLLSIAEGGQPAVNTILSLNETYHDLAPVRTSKNGVAAFVSIMRGCEQYCSYCIVPFTRGKERSRSADSIVKEVRDLSEQGYKEVTLLGQNVNSYNDNSELKPENSHRVPLEAHREAPSRGFKQTARKPVVGVGFTELLDRVSRVDSNLRVRFTSPHPKDFPDELLQLIRDTPNLCSQIHMPVQSGSTAVLDRMRRNYTQEAFLDLVKLIRATIPRVCISTDIITGFCGETDEDHAMSIDVMQQVQFDQAFMYKYSQREKTFAHRKYQDDVPEAVKGSRLIEIVDTFRRGSLRNNLELVGETELVLVEGRSRRSEDDLMGRTDGYKQVIFKKAPLPDLDGTMREPRVGDYVKVKLNAATAASFKGTALCISDVVHFAAETKQAAAK